MKSTATVLPAEGLRARKKKETHQRICDAATALFIQLGYTETTCDAIALQANISKPTFFNYFPSKLAVLHTLIDEMDRQFLLYINDEIRQPDTTARRLQSLLARSARYINRSPALTRLILVEGMGALGNVDKSQARFSRLHEAMASLLNAGVEQGDVRTDYSIELLVQMLVGGYLYALLNWLSSQQVDLTVRLAETAGFLAESLAPPTAQPPR
ncbi:MAG: TetR/AcrR family transcriptional regulator [SAR86 cluster bacterium]|uniref:TetR/AcrR family transcriptional regulator n=1 Tax=SAR86 cluster bacterium TaxID=2030880 RepID=A0A972W112_9GAMM|nr:TetR/AcrR family transcriptional regulator [SAR86 cluster bacterium]